MPPHTISVCSTRWRQQSLGLGKSCHSLEHENIPTVGAVEVIRMVGIIPKHQRLLINYQVALLTNVLAQSLSFFTVMAWPAQMPSWTKGRKENIKKFFLLKQCILHPVRCTSLSRSVFWAQTKYHLVRYPVFHQLHRKEYADRAVTEYFCSILQHSLVYNPSRISPCHFSRYPFQFF